MDVVYPVASRPRSGSATDELRFSLRSLAHIPHDRVFIAGWKPEWVKNVTHVGTVQSKGRWENAFRNMKAVLDQVSEEFVLMNDDFFIMEPFDRIPVLHRGPMGTVGQNSSYQKARANVYRIAQTAGVEEPLSYELHVPFVYDRDLLKETLGHLNGENIAGFQRSLYGNWNRIGGEYMADCKVTSNRPVPDVPFLSTSDASFRGGKIGKLIRERFPEPSPYE